MAAVTTVNANLVRQKAYNAVYGNSTVVTGGNPSPLSPYHFYALKALFLFLDCNKGNPDLQFLPFEDADLTNATGATLATGACHVYAFFVKSRTAPTTGAFASVYDNNSATGNTGNARISTYFGTGGGESFLWVDPNGLALANSPSVGSATTIGGSTASATGNGGDGFLIIGA